MIILLHSTQYLKYLIDWESTRRVRLDTALKVTMLTSSPLLEEQEYFLYALLIK